MIPANPNLLHKMYIMSTFSFERQSVAGGLLQAITRLGGAIGLGISTAIFNAIIESPPRSGYYASDHVAPYAGAFWFATGCCIVTLFLVPFLTIKTQGHGEHGRAFKKDEEQ